MCIRDSILPIVRCCHGNIVRYVLWFKQNGLCLLVIEKNKIKQCQHASDGNKTIGYVKNGKINQCHMDKIDNFSLCHAINHIAHTAAQNHSQCDAEQRMRTPKAVSYTQL